MDTTRLIVDEAALARPMESGQIGGPGLDVFDHEPSVNPRFVRRAGRVVLFPDMCSTTENGRVDTGEKVIVNIETFMDGKGRGAAGCRIYCRRHVYNILAI